MAQRWSASLPKCGAPPAQNVGRTEHHEAVESRLIRVCVAVRHILADVNLASSRDARSLAKALKNSLNVLG